MKLQLFSLECKQLEVDTKRIKYPNEHTEIMGRTLGFHIGLHNYLCISKYVAVFFHSLSTLEVIVFQKLIVNLVGNFV